jgi:hypothetical protein
MQMLKAIGTLGHVLFDLCELIKMYPVTIVSDIGTIGTSLMAAAMCRNYATINQVRTNVELVMDEFRAATGAADEKIENLKTDLYQILQDLSSK